MSSFKISKLSNGLEFIVSNNDTIDSVCISIAIRVGSNDEDKRVNGISHLVEHMLYKSNRVYKTKFELYNALDNIGAIYNAYTDKNITNFYAKCHYSKLRELINIFSVLICEPVLDIDDLNKERNIVIEEIKNSYDDPFEILANKIYNLSFEGNSICQTVAGSPKNIENISVDDILNHLRKFYVVDNMVIGLTGHLPSLDVVNDYLEKSSFVKIPQPIMKHEFRPKIIHKKNTDISILHIKSAQTYLAIGFPLHGIYNNDKFTLRVINCILNGSMSSRLFIKIREEKGLVYSIQSDINMYEEGGIFFIVTSFETNNKKCSEVLNAILNELKIIANNSVSNEELEKWKNYLRSVYSISHEESSGLCDYYVKQMLFYRDTVMDYRNLFSNYEKVSLEDINRVAKDVFNGKTMKIVVAGNYSIDSKSIVNDLRNVVKNIYNF